MDHQMINDWLQIPSQPWPPDHYALLGLDRGVTDPQQIEQAVHDRLAKLRSYQLSNPDLATVAMNQLAQAFMCLTDAHAKAEYDQTNGAATAVLSPPPTAEPSQSKPAIPKALLDTDVTSATKVDWQVAPPPVRGKSPATSPPPPPPAPIAKAPAEPPKSEFPRTPASADERRGLATIPAVLKRIDHTRQLLWAWEKVGRRLKKSAAKPTSALELDLQHWLEELAAWLDGFPQVLGQPGQPGYRVVALSRLDSAYPMVHAMASDQKAALMKDWSRGRDILTKHRRFLRYELKRLRRRSFIGRATRAMQIALNEHPGKVWLGITAATALAVWFFVLR